MSASAEAERRSHEPREIVARYQQAILDANADELAELYEPDAVHEIPFQFPGMRHRLEGREEIRSTYEAAWEASPARASHIEQSHLHETPDPEVLVVEQTVIGTTVATGAEFRLPGVLVFRIRNGAIVSLRDYLDGLAVARMAGLAPWS